jgi:hypothetical protein
VSPRAAGTLRSTGGRRSPATALRSRTSSGAIRRREFGPRDLPIGGLDSAPLRHATLAGVRISASSRRRRPGSPARLRAGREGRARAPRDFPPGEAGRRSSAGLPDASHTTMNGGHLSQGDTQIADSSGDRRHYEMDHLSYDVAGPMQNSELFGEVCEVRRRDCGRPSWPRRAAPRRGQWPRRHPRSAAARKRPRRW